jgi:hypothetical protein
MMVWMTITQTTMRTSHGHGLQCPSHQYDRFQVEQGHRQMAKDHHTSSGTVAFEGPMRCKWCLKIFSYQRGSWAPCAFVPVRSLLV